MAASEDCRDSQELQLIQEKARHYFNQLKDLEPSSSSCSRNVTFSASNGWFAGFVQRYALHNVKIQGEAASADETAAMNYRKVLAEIIDDGGYCPDQIFNADETGLFWKKMPSRTLIAKSEKTASGFKAAKDRITLLLCSNASAWVTSAVFTTWFNDCFVPEVEKYMEEMGLPFKVLLIVDNAPGHPCIEHPNIQMVFLPPNTTSLIQPLDQVRQSLKDPLKPVYEILSKEELLQRCLGGYTQNNNESYNQKIWKIAPKSTFGNLRIIETAAYVVAITFNDANRLMHARIKAQQQTKEARTARKQAKSMLNMTNEAQEGISYGSGISE
ncbi:tigger transposable element-derived protein 1-like [Cataglyphis hispanica]|uniref:tigger transposable element-derived protein 1-like n=1 Tax=Cataglyphis hispanica TaxID=1086592 RepID=UPI00217F2593|nr:tigger transposable element-derived protein 1-like [Cataglyphis hispanica]